MTPDARYEIGWTKDDMASMEDATSLKRSAMNAAREASLTKNGYTFYVFDRMARHGQICRWDFRNGMLVNSEVRE